MYVCDDGHEEIVYAGNDCPLCNANNKISGLEDDIDELKGKINDLESDLDDAQREAKSNEAL